MKMIKTDFFLGCYKLETGGVVIGWFNFISDVLCIIGCVVAIVFLSIFGCNFVGKSSGHRHESYMKNICSSRGIIIAGLIVTALICGGFAVIAFFCIKGTKSRDHIRVKPLMIVMAIAAIFSLLEIFSFTISGLFSGLIGGLFYGYMFVVLYSLFDMFRQEHESGAIQTVATVTLDKVEDPVSRF